MEMIALSLLKRKKKKSLRPDVAAAMPLGERRGSSTMNVKASRGFTAGRHVLSSAVIQEGSVG